MNISELSVTELEALAFRQICARDQANQNLQVIVEEIAKRAKAKPEVETEVSE
jgi:hypothetical protein